MKIALAQMKVVPGRPDINVERMKELIEKARQEGAELVAFPEMCVGGYLVGDRWLDDNWCRELMHWNDEICAASEAIAVAYGNVFLDDTLNDRVKGYHPNRDGRTRRYNAIYVMQDGKPAQRSVENSLLPPGVQPKVLLPNYRFFDDQRYFFSLEYWAIDAGIPLDDLCKPFVIYSDSHFKEMTVGFELCEDLWCNDYRSFGEAINPTRYLIEEGAEVIINLSASPWTFGKNGARDRRVQFMRDEIGEKSVPFLYVNCTGSQNNGKNFITFDGGSTVYNRCGEPVIFAQKAYEEELILTSAEARSMDGSSRIEKSRIAQKYDAVIAGLKHIKDMTAMKDDPRFILGLSGGIDSAVVAALCTAAVGAENVLAVNMPTRYNSDRTRDAAAHIAEALRIHYDILPIEELVTVNDELLESIDLDGSGKKLSLLNEENIQAKIRGTSILSNLAAKYNALMTNNGNKLEIALGYATLYGDINGAVAPLGDLTKSEVYEMARFLNEEIFKKEVIPQSLIPNELFQFNDDQIVPSAELKDDQVDPIKFGYHCALIEAMTDYRKKTIEDVLQWYLDKSLEENLNISRELIERWDIHKPEVFFEDILWFDRQIRNSVFKRIQAPPIIITSKSAYGYDIRETMLPYTLSVKAEKLLTEVMKMSSY